MLNVPASSDELYGASSSEDGRDSLSNGDSDEELHDADTDGVDHRPRGQQSSPRPGNLQGNGRSDETRSPTVKSHKPIKNVRIGDTDSGDTESEANEPDPRPVASSTNPIERLRAPDGFYNSQKPGASGPRLEGRSFGDSGNSDDSDEYEDVDEEDSDEEMDDDSGDDEGEDDDGGSDDSEGREKDDANDDVEVKLESEDERSPRRGRRTKKGAAKLEDAEADESDDDDEDEEDRLAELFPALKTYQSLVAAFCEFLTVAIHTILYERKVYPAKGFHNARKYNQPVRLCRHPGACRWIQDAVNEVEMQLLRCTVYQTSLVIFSQDPITPQERYVFSTDSFPVVSLQNINTPFEEDYDDADGVELDGITRDRGPQNFNDGMDGVSSNEEETSASEMEDMPRSQLLHASRSFARYPSAKRKNHFDSLPYRPPTPPLSRSQQEIPLGQISPEAAEVPGHHTLPGSTTNIEQVQNSVLAPNREADGMARPQADIASGAATTPMITNPQAQQSKKGPTTNTAIAGQSSSSGSRQASDSAGDDAVTGQDHGREASEETDSASSSSSDGESDESDEPPYGEHLKEMENANLVNQFAAVLDRLCALSNQLPPLPENCSFTLAVELRGSPYDKKPARKPKSLMPLEPQLQAKAPGKLQMPPAKARPAKVPEQEIEAAKVAAEGQPKGVLRRSKSSSGDKEASKRRKKKVRFNIPEGQGKGDEPPPPETIMIPETFPVRTVEEGHFKMEVWVEKDIEEETPESREWKRKQEEYAYDPKDDIVVPSSPDIFS